MVEQGIGMLRKRLNKAMLGNGDIRCISCGVKLSYGVSHKCSPAHEAARLQIQRTYYRNPIPPSYNERLQYGFSLTSMDD